MPDARVQAAIDHWAPRFVQAGVDYNDFVATTARVERWEDWLARLVPNGDMHAVLAEEAAAQRAAPHAPARRGRGRPWPTTSRSSSGWWTPSAAAPRPTGRWPRWRGRTSTSTRTPSASRCRSTAAGSSATCAGPPSEERPPLVLLVPGLDSTKEEFFRLENVFLDRGMATLSIDGPGQGESGYELPIRPDYDVAVTAVLDALAGRTDVDLDRVGLLGVSLGGYYAPRVLAFEPRVKAGVGLSGPYRFSDIWDDVAAADARDVRGQVVRAATRTRGAPRRPSST